MRPNKLVCHEGKSVEFVLFLERFSHFGSFKEVLALTDEAGTDLLRFTGFWQKFQILNLPISQMAPESLNSNQMPTMAQII